jgi:hypothetical protein
MATTNSVATVAGQEEFQLYSIGPSGLKLFASSSSNPRVDAIFPTRDGQGFYGKTQAGLVAIIPRGKGWVRKRLIDLDLAGYWPNARLIQTPSHLALVVPGKGLFRMRRNTDGTLALLGREDAPEGWIPSG